MRVAVAQFAATMDLEANRARIAVLAAAAAESRARLLVLPEASMLDFGEAGDDLLGPSEPLDGPFVEELTRLARRLDLTIVAGMFERIPGDPRIYNTAVAVSPEGLAGSYRKRHLFDAFGDRESDRIRPGDSGPLLLDLEGFKAAVVICYDIRFPSFIEGAAGAGADILLVPSAWVAGPNKEDHWMVMARARAMENTIYVAGAGQTPPRYCGRSMVADPMGVPIAGLAEAEGVATAEVSRERLTAVRERLPLLAQRRAQAGVASQPG